MRWLTSALLLATWLVGMTSARSPTPWLHVLLVIACMSLLSALLERDARDTI